MTQDEALNRIEAKLSALLAISVDSYLRKNPEIAKPRPRTIDQMLADAGLAAKDIASLLGKSEQAVYQQLDRNKKVKKPGSRGTKRRSEA